ncbi:MAG TPA: YraN family protein [Nitriliruptorales bacterium]
MDTTPRPRPDATLAERRRHLGRLGEDAAASWLVDAGMEVLARNWRLRTGAVRGELDLICRDGDTLVVVEVKTRRTDRFGGPLLAVTRDKQERIRALASAFLRHEQVRAPRVRFDVVGVTVDGGEPGGVHIEHVRQAF